MPSLHKSDLSLAVALSARAEAAETAAWEWYSRRPSPHIRLLAARASASARKARAGVAFLRYCRPGREGRAFTLGQIEAAAELAESANCAAFTLSRREA